MTRVDLNRFPDRRFKRENRTLSTFCFYSFAFDKFTLQRQRVQLLAVEKNVSSKTTYRCFEGNILWGIKSCL